MNSYKLHIDLSRGLIEAEGDKEFVMHVYNDFKDTAAAARAQQEAIPRSPQNKSHRLSAPIEAGAAEKTKPRASQKAKSGRDDTLALNKDLNFYAEGNEPSLRDYMARFDAPTNQTIVLLFVSYLKDRKNVERVGKSEIYTCYKHMGFKIPNIFDCLKDTARHKGWLDASNSDDVKITRAGENAVTHELPKKDPAAV